MKVFYGVQYAYVDVSEKVAQHCVKDNKMILPKTDPERAAIFQDHLGGILKHIKITAPGRPDKIIASGETCEIQLNEENELDLQPWIRDVNDNLRSWYHTDGKLISDPTERLEEIHKRLIFQHGNPRHEYPEQELAMQFIGPDSVVLEIGANIGRNTCLIATLLSDDRNLVTLETMSDSVKKLQDNRDLNGFRFHIEPSALSKQPLIQSMWWSEVSDVVRPGYVKVNTITWTQLLEKYPLPFDTLVADCEGALYHILLDEPDMLKHFRTIIVENDYTQPHQYPTVMDIFKKYGFEVACTRSGGGGFCQHCFYQVFVKPR